MREGFTVKEIAAVLGMHPGSVTTAITQPLRKMARLYLADPVKFSEMWLPVLRDVQGEMSEEELAARELMLEGRTDRPELHGERR